jgi:hypothetical protein
MLVMNDEAEPDIARSGKVVVLNEQNVHDEAGQLSTCKFGTSASGYRRSL